MLAKELTMFLTLYPECINYNIKAQVFRENIADLIILPTNHRNLIPKFVTFKRLD